MGHGYCVCTGQGHDERCRPLESEQAMNPQLSQTGTRLQAVDLRPHSPVAARATIESYRDIAGSMDSCDRMTQELLDDIIASEEGRASNLAGLLEVVSSPRVW